MNCPACKNAMIVVEHKRIELDYCPRCQGVWFDSGELELWLESVEHGDTRQFLGDILKAQEAVSAEKRRKCPICHQRMGKTTIGQQPAILIDVCRRGDGLWFDGGEFEQLLRELATKPAGKPSFQPPVIDFLGEVFKGRK